MCRLKWTMLGRVTALLFVGMGSFVLSGAMNSILSSSEHSQVRGSLQSDVETRQAVATLLSLASRRLKRAFPSIRVESLERSICAECESAGTPPSEYVVLFEAPPPGDDFARGEQYSISISSDDLTVTRINVRPALSLKDEMREIMGLIQRTLGDDPTKPSPP